MDQIVTRMVTHGLVLYPTTGDGGTGFYLAKQEDLREFQRCDGPASYGNVERQVSGAFWASPHHPEHDDYGAECTFATLPDAVSYLLDDYERVSAQNGPRTGAYVTFGVVLDTTDEELIEKISQIINQTVGYLGNYRDNVSSELIVDCAQLKVESVELRGSRDDGIEFG